MNRNIQEDRYIIKRDGAYIFVTLLVIFVLFCKHGDLIQSLNFDAFLDIVIFIICILGLLTLLYVGCSNYVLDAKGITVSFLSIPLRKVYWHQIGEVIFAKKHRMGSKEPDNIIMIIPLDCGPFRIGTDRIDTYCSKHPFAVLEISIPAKKVKECTAAFQKYYGGISDIGFHK